MVCRQVTIGDKASGESLCSKPKGWHSSASKQLSVSPAFREKALSKMKQDYMLVLTSQISRYKGKRKTNALDVPVSSSGQQGVWRHSAQTPKSETAGCCGETVLCCMKTVYFSLQAPMLASISSNYNGFCLKTMK